MVPPDVLSRGRSGSRSPGLWFHCCRGTVKAAVLGFAKGSVSGGRDGRCLFSAFTWQIQCLVSGSTRCGFFRPDRGTDTAAIWFWGIRCSMCQCNVYWGLATSVACLWGASWGCDKSGWEIKYQFASREGGRSFKKQTWRMLLAVTRTTPMPGIDVFFPRCGDPGRNQFLIEFMVHKITLFLYIK